MKLLFVFFVLCLLSGAMAQTGAKETDEPMEAVYKYLECDDKHDGPDECEKMKAKIDRLDELREGLREGPRELWKMVENLKSKLQ